MTRAIQQPGTLPDTKNGINMTINLPQPFPVALEAGVDESTQQAVLGFVVDDFFVFNPRQSTCGRFEVDPEQAYGLAPEAADQLIALNKLIDQATQAAINESCRVIQEALGISSGDSAGHHFSDDDNTLQFSRGVAAYLCHELKNEPASRTVGTARADQPELRTEYENTTEMGRAKCDDDPAA